MTQTGWQDTKKPTINVLVAYPQTDSSQINKSNAPLQLNFKTLPNGNLLADKITASGKIGFGINTYDRLNGALNKNGIYDLSVKVNGTKTYQHTLETFSFAESKYINLLIDYTRYAAISQKVQRCFVVPRNTLDIYTTRINDGFINIKDKSTYNVEIMASDFAGNQKKIIITHGKNNSKIIC